MHSALHLYLRDLIQGSSGLATAAVECDRAGGHEVCNYEHSLDPSVASLNDPSFSESNWEEGAYQSVKIKNGGSRGHPNRKVQPSREFSDRCLVSQGDANSLIRRRSRSSGRQSRRRTSSQARSLRKVFRAFDDEGDTFASLSAARSLRKVSRTFDDEVTVSCHCQPHLSNHSRRNSCRRRRRGPSWTYSSHLISLKLFIVPFTVVHAYPGTHRLIQPCLQKSGPGNVLPEWIPQSSDEHEAIIFEVPANNSRLISNLVALAVNFTLSQLDAITPSPELLYKMLSDINV
jgi:hypothetical protein